MIPARFLAFLALLGACALSATHAAEDSITPDRPDFVNSSDVVGKGRFQIETGLAFDRDTQDGTQVRQRSTPTLLRIGLSDTLELRFETEGALRLSTEQGGVTSHVYGHADLAMGLKWHRQDGDEASGRPGTAWLFNVDTDSGSRAFRGKGWRPSVQYVAEWDGPDGYSLGLMPGLFVEHDDAGQRYIGGVAAVTVGKALNDQLHGFVELAGQQLAAPRHGGHVVTADVGLAYLLTHSVQVDTAMFWGVSRAAPDFGWTVGVSAKF
ncbi:MAG: transporter [Acidobacteriota bacterium]